MKDGWNLLRWGVSHRDVGGEDSTNWVRVPFRGKELTGVLSHLTPNLPAFPGMPLLLKDSAQHPNVNLVVFADTISVWDFPVKVPHHWYFGENKPRGKEVLLRRTKMIEGVSFFVHFESLVLPSVALASRTTQS